MGGRVPSVILFPSSGSVDAITDYLSGLRGGGHRPLVAAMGASSSATAGAHGWPPDVVAPLTGSGRVRAERHAIRAGERRMTSTGSPTQRTTLVARPRRLRSSPAMRALVRETQINRDGLVQPLFVVAGHDVVQPIGSMPGVSRYSVDAVVRECRELDAVGVRAVLLFGIPDAADKDAYATVNYDPNGIVQRAARAIKDALPNMLVIADLCNCEYTDHGHCGILDPSGDVDNDRTLDVLAKTAVTYARAGVDIVAPSDMMDGRVAAIRTALDGDGFTKTAIMSYAAKYASAFYGPFREAAESTPSFGDRRTYQMDPANAREALKEVRLDVEEGADVVMVKPAMAYLDVVRAVREMTDLPVAVYHVSGEYSMLKAAAERGWIDEERAVDETLTAMTRAGADIIITYFAKDYLGEPGDRARAVSRPSACASSRAARRRGCRASSRSTSATCRCSCASTATCRRAARRGSRPKASCRRKFARTSRRRKSSTAGRCAVRCPVCSRR